MKKIKPKKQLKEPFEKIFSFWGLGTEYRLSASQTKDCLTLFIETDSEDGQHEYYFCGKRGALDFAETIVAAVKQAKVV